MLFKKIAVAACKYTSESQVNDRLFSQYSLYSIVLVGEELGMMVGRQGRLEWEAMTRTEKVDRGMILFLIRLFYTIVN